MCLGGRCAARHCAEVRLRIRRGRIRFLRQESSEIQAYWFTCRHSDFLARFPRSGKFCNGSSRRYRTLVTVWLSRGTRSLQTVHPTLRQAHTLWSHNTHHTPLWQLSVLWRDVPSCSVITGIKRFRRYQFRLL